MNCFTRTSPIPAPSIAFSPMRPIPPANNQIALPKPTTVKLPRGLRMGHVNVRDIHSKSKKDDVRNIIENNNFHVFGVTETWLTSSSESAELEIPGYQLI